MSIRSTLWRVLLCISLILNGSALASTSMPVSLQLDRTAVVIIIETLTIRRLGIDRLSAQLDAVGCSIPTSWHLGVIARCQRGIRQQLVCQEWNGGAARLPVLRHYYQPGYSQKHDRQRGKRENCMLSAYQSGLF